MESGRRLINDLMAEQIAVSIVHRITCSSLGYFIQSSPFIVLCLTLVQWSLAMSGIFSKAKK